MRCRRRQAGNDAQARFCEDCLLAHCHLGLGKLSWRSGKRPEAQKHLAAATTMYREMDMRFWLTQAEAGSG